MFKLSSPATQEFWEIAVLYEDEHLLALDKPSGLLTSPDREDPARPNLVKLLHAAIAEGKPWVREHRLAYLMNSHRLDFETSGVILFAKSKSVLLALANLFGSGKPGERYHALVQGSPREDQFEVTAKLGPQPPDMRRMRVDPKLGKRSHTVFQVTERFSAWTLLACEPLTSRRHQIRVHLRFARLPVVGDFLYGGKPLLLSTLKKGYRLKPKQTERPLIGRAALHASALNLRHPTTGQLLTIEAPWPKDFTVAVKYLRRYAQGDSSQNLQRPEVSSPAIARPPSARADDFPPGRK